MQAVDGKQKIYLEWPNHHAYLKQSMYFEEFYHLLFHHCSYLFYFNNQLYVQMSEISTQWKLMLFRRHKIKSSVNSWLQVTKYTETDRKACH